MNSEILLDREEIAKVWEEAPVPMQLSDFIVWLARNHESWGRWKYVGAFILPEEDVKSGRPLWTNAYWTISKSEIGGPRKPFRSPYFLIENDRQLVLAKLLLTTMEAWEYHTAKQIMTS